MCNNGVNTAQFETMIDLLDDHVALEYRWAHKMTHTAGDAGFSRASNSLHEAQALLADVRALLAEAKANLESNDVPLGEPTVKLMQ